MNIPLWRVPPVFTLCSRTNCPSYSPIMKPALGTVTADDSLMWVVTHAGFAECAAQTSHTASTKLSLSGTLSRTGSKLSSRMILMVVLSASVTSNRDEIWTQTVAIAFRFFHHSFQGRKLQYAKSSVFYLVLQRPWVAQHNLKSELHYILWPNS